MQCRHSPEFAAHFRGVRPLRSRATGFPPFSKQKRTVGRWECHAAQCSTVYLHNKHNKGKDNTIGVGLCPPLRPKQCTHNEASRG